MPDSATWAAPRVHVSPGSLAFCLLNNYQRNFPLVARPFAELARQLAVDEASVIAHFQQLHQQGVVSRIGAVFRPNVIGVSALAALAVPPERLDTVAAQVSALPAVNHNYQREHRYNLWFVATASSPAALQATFEAIEAQCGCGPVLVLPLLEQFHIDLGFCMRQGHAPRVTTATHVPAIELSTAQQRLLGRLQQGVAFTERPFAELGWEEAQALTQLTAWTQAGVISRFGVVVRHHELGYTANAMVVWDVPDAQVSEVGRAMANSGAVSLCYRRPRVLPHWPYNLFCMLHGQDRQEVEQRLAALRQTCDLAAYPHDVLFSGQRFKQRGARYVSDLAPSLPSEPAHGPN